MSYGICIQAMNWAGVADKKKQKIEKDTTKIANKIRKKKKVKVGFKTKAFFMLMRMLQQANMASGPADKAYWEKMGWLGKGRPWK